MVELSAKRCPATAPTASASAARLIPCALAGELFCSISQPAVLKCASIVQRRLSMLWKTRIHSNCAWTCAFWLDPNFRQSSCKTCTDAFELLVSAITDIVQYMGARNSEASRVCTRTHAFCAPAKSLYHRELHSTALADREQTYSSYIPCRSDISKIRSGSLNRTLQEKILTCTSSSLQEVRKFLCD